MSPERPPVGIIGLGLLGVPIAEHLIAAGHAVYGYDVDPARMWAATEVGVTPAGSAARVAARVEVLVTALPSGASLDAVCDDLTAGTATRARILVDVSTLPVERKRIAAERLGALDITMLDCPVLGTSEQARAGELVMCVSGEPAAASDVDEILDAFTARREYLGEFGAGTTMKLVANLLVGVHNAAAAEALTLARRAGIDGDTALRVLTGSAGGSRQLELRGPMMVSDSFTPPAATSSVFIKDVELISALAEDVDAAVPMHAAARELFHLSMQMGNGDLDLSSVHRVFSTPDGPDAEGRSDAR